MSESSTTQPQNRSNSNTLSQSKHTRTNVLQNSNCKNDAQHPSSKDDEIQEHDNISNVILKQANKTTVHLNCEYYNMTLDLIIGRTKPNIIYLKYILIHKKNGYRLKELVQKVNYSI